MLQSVVSIEDSRFFALWRPKTSINTGFFLQTNDLGERMPKFGLNPRFSTTFPYGSTLLISGV
jgi:hypothetical protein